MTIQMKLHYPVHAPDGKVLMPAGTELTDQAIAELIRSSHDRTFDFVNVMQYGTIADNLHKILSDPPYDRIFSDCSRTRSVIALLKKAELPAPLFEIIDFFKYGDPYTYRHLLIVFALSMLLAHYFIEDAYELQVAAQACTTHDLGKFCIPMAVLKKSTLLDQDERHYLEHHSAAGYVLLSYYFKDPGHMAAITARDHHERCDGSGYPTGKMLENRIVEIVAACDVFDALTANRPYRPTAYNLRSTLDEITEMASRGAIPWDIAKTLIIFNRKQRVFLDECKVSLKRRGKPPGDNMYQGACALKIRP